MYRMLREQKNVIADDVVNFAQELINTPSISLGENDAAVKIEQKMNELGYDKVIRDDNGNVVGILFGRNPEPSILLNCHMDTVPVADKKQWTHAPFSAAICDGRLYGVGSSDCKAGLAAHVYAGFLLKQSMLPLDGNVIVAATVAEENGLSVGVRSLINTTLPTLGLKPTYAILGEPTGLGLYYGHDGWMEMDILVEGTNPFHVDDATKDILNELKHGMYKPEISHQEEIHVGIPTYEQHNGALRTKVRMSRRIRQMESVDDIISQIKHNAMLISQQKSNVVVDVLVRREKQQLANGTITTVEHITHAWATDPFSPLMDRARQILGAAGCAVRPGKWNLDRLHMGTAGSVLVNEYGIPTIGYGPGEETEAHACDESVDVTAITEACYGTAAIVQGLIGVPVYGWTSDEI